MTAALKAISGRLFCPGSISGHYFIAHTYQNVFMSHAFVKEGDEQWLHDISPTMNALIAYLTRENNGVRVYERSVSLHPKLQKQVHLMSNGLMYAIDDSGKWFVAD